MKKLLIILLLLPLPVQALQRYVLQADSAVVWRSLEFAKQQIGVRERTGHNDGFAVEMYLRSVGLGKGYPYCMAGQYWSFDKAANQLEEPNPLLRTGSVLAQFNYAKSNGEKTKPIPFVSDLICWRLGRTTSGHIERITGTGKAGWITTVAFNTSNNSNSSQREGGGVYEKQRNYLHVLGRMNVLGFIGFKR